MRLGGQGHAPATLPPGKTGSHFIGDWTGHRTGQERCRKSRLHQDSIPGPSSPQQSPPNSNNMSNVYRAVVD